MARPHVAVAFSDEPLRLVVYRMAAEEVTRLPVVERTHPRRLVGMVSLDDLLKARTRNLEEERHRERVLRLHMLVPLRWRRERSRATADIANPVRGGGETTARTADV